MFFAAKFANKQKMFPMGVGTVVMKKCKQLVKTTTKIFCLTVTQCFITSVATVTSKRV